MPRKQLGDNGRTSRVPVVTFRLSATERLALEEQASAVALTANELARRRTLQLPEVDVPGVVIEPPAEPVRELTLHRDEESP